MSRRERNITPYPQHVTGILGPIDKYHSKDSLLHKFFKKNLKNGGRAALSAPLGPPSKSAHEPVVAHSLLNFFDIIIF